MPPLSLCFFLHFFVHFVCVEGEGCYRLVLSDKMMVLGSYLLLFDPQIVAHPNRLQINPLIAIDAGWFCSPIGFPGMLQPTNSL